MTAAPKVTIEGLPEVEAALDGLAADTADVRAPSTELGRIGEEAALRVVPRLTGALAAAITPRPDEHGVALVVDERYALAMEFGTRFVLGHRYMGAGFDAMSQAAPAVYEQWLESKVKKNGGTA